MNQNDDELLRAARDAAVREREASGEPAPETSSAERVERLERVLGFTLWPLHRRLLSEVANGGVGPGFGFVGIPDSVFTDALATQEARDRMWEHEEISSLPRFVLPVCSWGDAISTCLDERNGRVLTNDGGDFYDFGWSLRDFVGAWIRGEDPWCAMMSERTITGIGPFTRQPRTVTMRTEPRGTRWVPD